jgi:uncharacterized protein
MIKRHLENSILKAAEQYQVISISGPRQSGKTTLSKYLFPEYKYVNLESPDVRLFAQEDPRAFLSQSDFMIIDEIQNVSELLSYIQVIVDDDKTRRFIITGSQNLLISEKVSQSLAGRVAIFTLLPLSLEELRDANIMKASLREQIYTGLYPKIYDDNLDPSTWYSNYIQTYLDRDVRQIKNVENLSLFHKFIGLLAGRTGQILNQSSLANDVGVTVPTINSWLSVLEASYIIFLLQPYYKNWNKRLTKSPKIHFYDVGLACNLLNIKSTEDLENHPLLGNIFETFVVSEYIKKSINSNSNDQPYYWREKDGKEVDLIINKGRQISAIEVKLGQTFSSKQVENLLYYKKVSEETTVELQLVYGGDENQNRSNYDVVSWNQI